MEYVTVAREGQDEFVEKRSRFIGHCRPVSTEREALDFITALKTKYWDASHNVYAYILREGNIQRFSDDGEPQGTAGIPALETLKKAGVTDCAVVATRYFGGILLGGGGLVRAYAHTASIALAAAGRVVMRECAVCSLVCDYALYGRVQAVLAEGGAALDDTAFTHVVTLRFHLPTGGLPALEKRLADATSGAAVVQLEGRAVYPFDQ